MTTKSINTVYSLGVLCCWEDRAKPGNYIGYVTARYRAQTPLGQRKWRPGSTDTALHEQNTYFDRFKTVIKSRGFLELHNKRYSSSIASRTQL